MTTQLHPAVAADRRNRRNKKVEFWLGALFNAIAVGLAGLMFMLAVGIVHHDWIAACPTISLGKATLVAALLRGALAPIPNWRKP